MKVETLAGDAIHYTYNDVHHYLVKSAGYAKAWADQRQAKGKKASLSQGIVHAVGCFLKMYLLKRGFRWKTGIFNCTALCTLYLCKIRRLVGT